MKAEDFRMIFRYNRRVLHSFLQTLETLPSETASMNLGASHGSMRDIFTHILTVYDGWLNHARKGETFGVPDYELDAAFGSMNAAKRYMEHVEAGVDALLQELNDSMLTLPVKVDWMDREQSLADALMQVTVEQAHHLGELITLLWQHDVEPPEMTWIGVHEALKA